MSKEVRIYARVLLTYFVRFAPGRGTHHSGRKVKMQVHVNDPEQALFFMQRILEASQGDPEFRIGRAFTITSIYAHLPV